MTRGLAALLWVAVALTAGSFAPVSAQEPAAAGAPTDVVATVGDSPIFRSELDEIVRRGQANSVVSGTSADVAATAAGADRQQRLEAVAMEQLVDARLLRMEMERAQVTVGRLDIEQRIAQLKKQMAARGIEWDRFLALSGRDADSITEQIELEIGLDRLIRPKLTPAVVTAGFEKYRRTLDGTRLRVSHVILRPDVARGEEGVTATMARAAAIRREIVQGAVSFADAARRYSAGPSRARGGDLGVIGREGPMVEPFTKEAFALAKGDVSKPFVTQFGIHIVQVTDVEPGRLGFEALRPKLEVLLAENLLRDLLTRLRSTTPVAYAPGVAHFEPAGPDPNAPRRVVVEPGGRASAPAVLPGP